MDTGENEENIDREEEKKFSLALWSHNRTFSEAIEQHVLQTSEWTEEAKKTIPHRLNVKYGETDRTVFDIYSEDLPGDSPIFVFIHGGAWTLGSNEGYGYLAKPFRENGIVTITVTYDLAPSVTLIKMVEEIKQCMTLIVQLAQQRNSKGIYLSGHSAGGHLAAMLMSSEWMNEPINRKYMKGIIFMSAVFDLEKMKIIQIGKLAKITEEVVEKVSPMRFVKESSKNLKTDFKILIAFAGHDPPGLIEESKNYNQELLKHGVSPTLLFLEDEDHFTIVEKLHDKDHIFTKFLNWLSEDTSFLVASKWSLTSLNFCKEETTKTDRSQL